MDEFYDPERGLLASDEERRREVADPESGLITPNKIEQRVQNAQAYYRKNADEFFGPGSASYTIERIPGVSAGAASAYYYGLHQAAKDVQGGNPSDESINLIAEHLAKQEYESKRGFGQRALDLGTSLPGMAVEWIASGGVAGGVKAGVEKSLEKVAAKGLAGTIAQKAAGYTAAGAARTALMPSTYGGIASETVGQDEQGMPTPQGLPGAVARGGLKSLVQNTIFEASGMFASKGGEAFIPGTLKSLGKAEAGMQLSKESLYWLALNGKPSEIHQVLTGPDRGKALQELGAEGLAIGGLEAFMHAVPAVKGRYDQLRRGGVRPDSAYMQQELEKVATAFVPREEGGAGGPFGTSALAEPAAPPETPPEPPRTAPEPPVEPAVTQAPLEAPAAEPAPPPAVPEAPAEPVSPFAHMDDAAVKSLAEFAGEKRTGGLSRAALEKRLLKNPLAVQIATEGKARETGPRVIQPEPRPPEPPADVAPEAPPTMPEAARETPPPAEPVLSPLERMRQRQQQLGEVKTPEQKVKEPTPLREFPESVPEEGPAPRNLDEEMDTAKLTAKEKHVLYERLKDRPLEEIAQDREVSKRGGQPLTRERVRQIEAAAQKKLGKDLSVYKQKLLDAAEKKLDAVQHGREVEKAAYGELGGEEASDPEIIRPIAGRRLSAIDQARNDLVRLNREFEKEASDARQKGLALSEERRSYYDRRGKELAATTSGRPRPAAEEAGGLRREPAPADLAGHEEAPTEGETAAREQMIRSLADNIQEADRQAANRTAAMLRAAKASAKGRGVSLERMGSRNAKGKIDEASIRLLDDIAKSMATEYPDVFAGHPDLQERLFNLLVEGSPRTISRDKALVQARQIIADSERQPAAPTGDLQGEDLISPEEAAKTTEVAPGVHFAPLVPPFLQPYLSNRKVGPVPPTKITPGDLPPLQDWGEIKAIASEPRGVAKLGGVGRLMDQRARAETPDAEALLGYKAVKKMADSHGNVTTAELREKYRNDFKFKDQELVLANGQTAPLADVMEAELRQPGSQPITPRQRQFLQEYSAIRAKLEQNSSGIGRAWVDSEGNPMGPAYFPRTSTQSAAGKVGMSHGTQLRWFESEGEGIKAGTKYVLDPFERVGQLVREAYRLDAEHLLGNDPALGAKTPAQWFADEVQKHAGTMANMTPTQKQAFLDRLKSRADDLPYSKDQPGSIRSWTTGKIYPEDVAKRLIGEFGQKPYGWVSGLESLGDAMKVVRLTADVAVGQIQLAPLAFRNPIAWAKATYAQAAHFFTGRSGLERYMSDPANREAASSLIQSGGTLGTVPDFLEGTSEGSALGKIPVVGKAFEHMGASVGSAFDVAKLEMWKAYTSKPRPPADLAGMAETIENNLGMGRTVVGPGQRSLEKLVWVSPSYFRSFLGQIGDLAYGSNASRIETLRVLGSYLAGTVALGYAGMKTAGLDDEEIKKRFNPGNSKFMMVPISLPDGSKQEIGLGGIHRAVLKLVADVAKPGATAQERWEGLRKFATNRLGFVPQILDELKSGKDYRGEPVSLGQTLAGAVTPGVVQPLLKEGTGAQKAAGVAGEFLGLREFPQSWNDVYKEKLNAEAKSRGWDAYDNLGIHQQAALVKILEKQGVKKPPSTPEQDALAIRHQEENRKALQEMLSKDSQSKLGALGEQIPRYDNSLSVNGVNVKLDEDGAKEYQKVLAEEYDKAVKSWDKDKLESAPPGPREEFLKRSLEAAKTRARKRMIGLRARGRRRAS